MRIVKKNLVVDYPVLVFYLNIFNHSFFELILEAFISNKIVDYLGFLRLFSIGIDSEKVFPS